MTVWQRAARVQCMCTHADATSTFPAAQMHLLGNAAVAQVRCALANQLLSRTRHTCGRATARLRVSGERACGVDGAPQLVTSVYEPFVTVSIHVKMQQTRSTPPPPSPFARPPHRP